VKKTLTVGAYVLAMATLASLMATRPRAAAGDVLTWNPKAAAAYLDQRQDWWQKWPSAARDRGTFCVSCHTAATYALGRPALRGALHEAGPSASELALQENVTKRVTMWKDVEPFYPDQTRGLPKSSESRGTEAILNALILSGRDARGRSLGDDTRRAFDNLWALQFTKGEQAGGWAWLNFHYEPWEAEGSAYYGAALAAIAIGVAPGGYAASAENQDRMKLLRDFLSRSAGKQHLFNRVTLLWASATWAAAAGGTAIVTPDEQRAIVDDLLRVQQDDGGWSMASLGSWKRVDNTPNDIHSDGYATGLVAYVLQAAAEPRAKAQVTRALAWLVTHQDPATGAWFATSLNKQRDPASDAGRFMNDAATAYAVMALTKAP
jgi:squalene-hopene/tetraprenyl-beta-curcumene cyclase